MCRKRRWRRRNKTCVRCARSRVEPLVADYTSSMDFIADVPAPRLILYLGSSIGNFEPLHASRLMARLRARLSPGDTLLLGTDLVKPASVLLPAYDDAAGVTAAFNLNLLVRINRELGADFDPESFAHVARWNAVASRMEMLPGKPARAGGRNTGAAHARAFCARRNHSHRKQLQVHRHHGGLHPAKRRFHARLHLAGPAPLVCHASGENSAISS